jgi:hypothetical protein
VEAFEHSDSSTWRPVIQMDQPAGRSVTIEPNGWLFTDDALATKPSVGTQLVSSYWNGNA